MKFCHAETHFTLLEKIGRRHINGDFERIFFAISWSKLDVNGLQYALIDYQAFHKALNEVQSHNSTWEHNSSQVLGTLAYHKIPKSSSVVFKVPESNLSISVSFMSARVNDPTLCQNRLWSNRFVCDLHKTEETPRPRNGQWRLEDY